ncbi:exocyst complex component Sec10 [Sistotremastrum niveocremeum HHB9708]|uniref:Exocyst complex component Sec10 n=1 Tax=Sistotremastrum niveocremeum HHB9708 TaxID=1314777 RepID=A0A164ZNH2_9AGAM|nr:exocyst complex component Sec10 [Sistotremastrum niveocremeum HHB9708]
MSHAPAGLFDLDDSIKEHLEPSSFNEKFAVKDFVNSLSEQLIANSEREPGPFDPKPFIRTFEGAVDRLLALRKDVQQRTEQLDQAVRVAEREYSKKMRDLDGGFDAVGKSFNSMESRISQVGKTAIRIGEQLESVHISRQRAQAAYDLIDYYFAFARDDTSKIDALRKEGGRDGRHKAAVILRRLMILAKEVDIPSAEQTRENIEKYCETFEKSMLTLFDRCYRKGDPKVMHHCALTLLEFNGGSSCVQMYVNQHDFFISKNRVQEIDSVESSPLWDTLPDPDASLPPNESGLSDLLGEIRSTFDQEIQIVQAVFPNPPVVMQVFLQRVFAQSIQQYLEMLLNKASSLSTLAFLRILQVSHIQIAALVDDLKAYELPIATSRQSSLDPSSPTKVSMSSGTVVVPIGAMLDTALEELFSTYTESQRYLERETKNLGELYSSYLARFTNYHSSTQKAKTSGLRSYGLNLYDELTKSATTKATEMSSTGTSRTAAMAATAFLRVAGKSTSTIEKAKEEPPKEADGQLSVDVTERMLKWHAEAIGRCVELAHPNDVAKHAFALMRVLAETLGPAYIELAIETALGRLEGAKIEALDLSSLAVIKQIDIICHLWQQYLSIALLPLANSTMTVRREMVIFNNQTLSRIEGAVNSLLQKIVDAVVLNLSEKLKMQQKSDFKPRNDDISFARLNTEPCTQCCEILERVLEAAEQNLSGKNLEVLLSEIGVAFNTLLLEHLKKFPVSATGGLMLAKDLKSYQDTISSFQIPSLSERFEFIRQLGNVFLLPPEALKTYINENYLARIDADLLRPYLQQRSDWSQFSKAFDGDENSVMEKGGFVTTRLGAWMENLENLRLGEGLTTSFPSSARGFLGGS